MKYEGISFELTPQDEDKTAKLEITIEHHLPGRARMIGEAAMHLLRDELYDIQVIDGTPSAHPTV